MSPLEYQIGKGASGTSFFRAFNSLSNRTLISYFLMSNFLQYNTPLTNSFLTFHDFTVIMVVLTSVILSVNLNTI